MKCGIDNGFGTVPLLSDFGSVNENAPFEETENLKLGLVSSFQCEDYQQFDSFFSKFMTVAKDFFLPSERHRVGLVSERSILSILGIQDSGSWMAVLYFAGCPSCLRMLNNEDDLNNVLKMDNPIVTEVSLFTIYVSVPNLSLVNAWIIKQQHELHLYNFSYVYLTLFFLFCSLLFLK